MFYEGKLIEVTSGKVIHGSDLKSSFYALAFVKAGCVSCEDAICVVKELRQLPQIVTVFIPLTDDDHLATAAHFGLQYSLPSATESRNFCMVYRVTYCPSIVILNQAGEVLDGKADVTLMEHGAEKAMISWKTAAALEIAQGAQGFRTPRLEEKTCSDENISNDVNFNNPTYASAADLQVKNEADISSCLAQNVMRSMFIDEDQVPQDVRLFQDVSDNPVKHWGIPPLQLTPQLQENPTTTTLGHEEASTPAFRNKVKTEILSPPARRPRYDDDYKPHYTQL